MKNKELTFLSKSKYLDGLKCHKLLWYVYNKKEDIPPVDTQTQTLFDEGKRVGEYAHKLFPGGILLERDSIPEKHHKKSLEAMELRKPLFEAGFAVKRAYALADILAPVKEDAWDLYEVKMATSVKDENIYDVAFQKYTYEQAGIKLHKCFLMYINNKYVRKGAIDTEELFMTEDVTEAADSLKKETESNIQKFLKVIEQDKSPEINIGQQCDEPYECPLKEICWQFLPKKHNVFILYRGRKLSFKLVREGVLDVLHLPEDTKLNDKQLIQVDSHKSGKPYIDKLALKIFLKEPEYPLYFLDFETIGPAIPVYELTSPYKQVPFQYSLHVIKDEGSEPEHYSYLAPDIKDPRENILIQLKDLLGEHGSIIGYNASFEINALKGMAEVYTDYQEWVHNLEKRFVDLLVPFRAFSYYHPDQEGSCSIKEVLPAVTGSGYDGLEIADGGTASSEYIRVTFEPNIPESERSRVRTALEKYCKLDTQAMIDILRVLKKVSL